MLKPGVDYLPPSGKVVGRLEHGNLAHVVLEDHYTEGPWVYKFERSLAKYMKARWTSMVNSGSSANLLALSALKEYMGLKPGDAVLTTAAGFPTTVNPIIQLGLTPLFIDVELGTYVPSAEMIEEAIYQLEPKAVMMAHTLGNPWPVDKARRFDSRIGIIEDCCDAMGSQYQGHPVGFYGDMGTLSFFPAHHITTGEGGAVFGNSVRWQKIVESFRDWGRDCWCDPGKENTCGKRFEWEFPCLPKGYDHKYVYSRIGYNMKSTDFEAAIGLAQMERLEGFRAARKVNFTRLYWMLEGLQDRELLVLPRATEDSEPNWFGFPITLQHPYNAGQLERYLNEHKIGSRRLFGGNLLKQPAYEDIDYLQMPLPNSDIIATQTLWVGIWPGLNWRHMNYIAMKIWDFFEFQDEVQKVSDQVKEAWARADRALSERR